MSQYGRKARWIAVASLCLLWSPQVFADEDVEEIAIPVTSDGNLMPAQAPEADVYWIDADDSEGEVVLQFRSTRLLDLPACDELAGTTSIVRLSVSIADVEDAESSDGFEVRSDGVRVGSVASVARGARVRIDLDPCLMPRREEVTFVLKPRGNDGVAVLPMRRGAGAQLDLILFHPRQDAMEMETDEGIPLTGGTARYLPALRERNIVNDGRPGTSFYWVDGDENEGKVELVFEAGSVFSRSVPDVYLVLRIPDVDWADSVDGLRVMWEGREIGRLAGAERDTTVEIPLTFDITRPQDRIELLLENPGTDGIAVAATRSGEGPQLKVVIPERGGR
jgi:hypothetical protein